MTNRLIPAIALALSVPLALAGCSGAGTESASPLPDATTSALPDASATTAAATTDPSPEPTAEVAIGNADDPFCAGALATIPPSDRIAELSANTGIFGSGTVEEINAWGEALAADTALVLVWYDDGEQYIEEPAVAEAWVTMEAFIRGYTVPVAEAAANAASMVDGIAAMSEVLSNDGMMELLEEAPAAAQVIRDYTVERCPGIAG